MGTPLLSAAMIVRDEEAFLPGCLDSLQGVVDEVVVVDTGSVDNSVEIARDAGAKVISEPWRDDFAAARNAALERATGDWILYIDADERVVGGLPERLRQQLREDDLLALTVRFRPVNGRTRYRESRLFRRHSRIRFRGSIHETHLPALCELLAEGGYRTGDSELAIDHLGYDGPLDRKHQRNLPLLRARLARDPHHVYSWVHLGHVLAALGRQQEADAAWRRGLEVVRAKRVKTSLDCLPYLALVEAQAARGEDCSELAREAWYYFPFNLEVRWLRARSLMGLERYEEAASLLETLVVIDASDVVSPLTSHDERLFRVWAPEALGLCLFRLQRYAESARWFGAAATAAPTRERDARHRIARARARSRVAAPGAGQ